MEGLGIPYMGSKRKLARDIVHFIRSENPNAKVFYDIFGGGEASLLKHYSNDLKKYIMLILIKACAT